MAGSGPDPSESGGLKDDNRQASSTGTSRRWHSRPEVDDDSVRAGTGRDWNQWCDLIDDWPGRGDGHAAIATFLQQEHRVGAWWAQTVTVGYERITGLRQPFQRPDGTFSISRSRKLPVDPVALRELLLSEESRRQLFPGEQTAVRSRPTAKVIRIVVGPGIATISITPGTDATAKVTVEHQQLPDASDVPVWQEYWSAWLAALPGTVAELTADEVHS